MKLITTSSFAFFRPLIFAPVMLTSFFSCETLSSPDSKSSNPETGKKSFEQKAIKEAFSSSSPSKMPLLGQKTISFNSIMSSRTESGGAEFKLYALPEAWCETTCSIFELVKATDVATDQNSPQKVMRISLTKATYQGLKAPGRFHESMLLSKQELERGVVFQNVGAMGNHVSAVELLSSGSNSAFGVTTTKISEAMAIGGEGPGFSAKFMGQTISLKFAEQKLESLFKINKDATYTVYGNIDELEGVERGKYKVFTVTKMSKL